MEYEISDNETLPDRQARPAIKQFDRQARVRQQADETRADPARGLGESVFQFNQQEG